MTRKLISSFLCLSALAGMTRTAGAAYTEGTYTGTGTGHNGPVSVEVTVSADAIEDIQVTESAESACIGDVAAEHVIADVLTYQSLDVDTVSGCTISRMGFLTAITDALSQAGADIDAWL